MQYDGSIKRKHLHYAYLIGSDDRIPSIEGISGHGYERGSLNYGWRSQFRVLLYGQPVVGTTEDALENLLGGIEDEVHKVLETKRREASRAE